MKILNFHFIQFKNYLIKLKLSVNIINIDMLLTLSSSIFKHQHQLQVQLFNLSWIINSLSFFSFSFVICLICICFHFWVLLHIFDHLYLWARMSSIFFLTHTLTPKTHTYTRISHHIQYNYLPFIIIIALTFKLIINTFSCLVWFLCI